MKTVISGGVVLLWLSASLAGGEDGDSFTFAVYGDSRDGHEIHARIVARINELRPDLVVHLGDFSKMGEAAGWEKFLEICDPLLTHPPRPGLPGYFFPVIGNHEVAGEGLSHYFNTFTAPPVDQFYYSFDYRDVHFIVLYVPSPNNWMEWTPAEFAPGSAQYQWLIRDLQDAAARPEVRHILVFFHAPFFSCTSMHGCGPSVQEVLTGPFQEFGVRAVFNSHVHSYQRFGPLKDLEADGEGIVYLVSAGGGAPLYPLTQEDCNVLHDGTPCDGWTGKPHRRISAVCSHEMCHFLLVTVAEDTLTGVAISPDGTVLDRFIVSPPPACGNTIQEPGEECDDGNLLDGDECSCECTIERSEFVRGDVNQDGNINVADPVFHLQYLFIRGPAPPCRDAVDANDDGQLNVADAVYMLSYFFLRTEAFPPPYPQRGPDPTPDELGCSSAQ